MAGTKPNILVRILKSYVRIIHNYLFYRRFVTIGRKNLPPKGTPTIVACNHQNCMNDPLGIVFAVDRHDKFYTRADIFSKPRRAKMLRAIGLLPAYRLGWDGGMDAVKNNEKSWNEGEQELNNGQTIVIFPEGMHQVRHWLGDFSFGYTKMAFEAAQMSGFEKEIFIQPAANHYKNYWHMQSDLAIIFGEPLSIAPYYELYKTKPRTAQREVNKIIHQRISDLMLDIRDTENYDEIDFIRKTYGKRFAVANSLNPNKIEQKLEADKRLVATLAEAQAAEPERVTKLYSEVKDYSAKIASLNLRDWVFEKQPTLPGTLCETIVMIILLPLFAAALVPNILIYLAPNLITPKLKDKMFKASIYLGVSLITIPLAYLLTIIFDIFLTKSVFLTIIHVILLPFLGLFAWYYRKNFIKLKAKFKYQNSKKLRKNAEIAPQRQNIWNELDNLLVKQRYSDN